MHAFEVNFDGLIGPTHHYGGLSPGNKASQSHRAQVSSPRRAALEGLRKMKLLADLEVPQAVLPPHFRPDLHFLREQGIRGRDREVLQRALLESPHLLSAAGSASAMWAANAATVSPSADTADGRVHFTPANLIANRHRSLEKDFTTRLLRRVFANDEHFVVHEALPNEPELSDEGAANHMRLAIEHGFEGVEVFVYGRDGSGPSPEKYPARQTRSACEAIAEQHQLLAGREVYLQQNPKAIDAGVFHNDVIAVANQDLLFCHEEAWLNREEALEQLQLAFGAIKIVEVPSRMLSLEKAVSSYLFNSQIVTLLDGGMRLICPEECREDADVQAAICLLRDSTADIRAVDYVDVRESMHNGGGPACLRLRVVLTVSQMLEIPGSLLLEETLYEKLADWVKRHYRDELRLQDLADESLLKESEAALDELTEMLELGPIYPFQEAR